MSTGLKLASVKTPGDWNREADLVMAILSSENLEDVTNEPSLQCCEKTENIYLLVKSPVA